ncbi:MAG: hypothetical protein AAGF20_00240 [Pseudomonadota bacterium]
MTLKDKRQLYDDLKDQIESVDARMSVVEEQKVTLKREFRSRVEACDDRWMRLNEQRNHLYRELEAIQDEVDPV